MSLCLILRVVSILMKQMLLKEIWLQNIGRGDSGVLNKLGANAGFCAGCTKRGESGSPTLRDACQAMVVCEAIYDSIERKPQWMSNFREYYT